MNKEMDELEMLKMKKYEEWRLFRDFWWQSDHIRLSMFDAFELFKKMLIERANRVNNEGK